jgi:uncharacterized membrane protein YccC
VRQEEVSGNRAISRWRPADPGLASLRRAARAALVIPPSFAFALLVVRDPQLTTFVAFGGFALLVLADFGGPRLPRAAAYAVTILAGAVLIVVGTLASGTVWLAALAMLVVGFCVQFAGVFGGYVAAAQPALLLSFVLAVSIPASPAAAGPRVGGWLAAGALSTLAALLLWPRFERQQLRERAAAACRALADLLREWRSDDGLKRRRPAAEEAVQTVKQVYAATAKRPAGPTRRDRAFVELLADLRRMLEFVDRRPGAGSPCLEEGARLEAAIVETLDGSAAVLIGGDWPHLAALEAARGAHRTALDRWARETIRAGRAPEVVLDGLGADHELRVVSYLALAIGSNAIVATGGSLEPEVRAPAGTPGQGPSRAVRRTLQVVRAHLSPASSVLQHAVRTGVGLALAVLLARLLRLDHAFWVVLGTSSVLRTNALATGRTMLQAVAGTVVGFAVGAAFTAAAGTNLAMLWAALPVAIFLAAYAPGAIGFVVGQAAFTINVLILFNLITPVGWRLGLARIEDILVGAGVSVVVSLLLWPRGARRQLSRALAASYRATAVFVGSSVARVLEGGHEREAARARVLAVQAGGRAGEAFEQYLNERAAKPLDPETGAFLVASGSHAVLVGDSLNLIADMGYLAGGCRPGADALSERSRDTLAALGRLAERLDGHGAGDTGDGPPPAPDGKLRGAALACLRRLREDPEAGPAAIGVVAAGEWIERLGHLTADLRGPVAEAAGAASMPWWR